MPKAQCFLSRKKTSLDALGDIIVQLRMTSPSQHCVGVLIASEHHRAHAEKIRGDIVQCGSLETLTGTISAAGLIGREGFFGEPFLALLRWETTPESAPKSLQISRLGDHNLDDSTQAALMLSSAATAPSLLRAATDHDIFTMGAVTFAAEPTLQFHREGSIVSGATGLGWAHADAIATAMLPSAEPLGDSYEITDTHQDIIIELDHRPAVEVLCDATNIAPDAAFESIGTDILIGVQRNAHDYHQDVYRHIVALDPVRQMFSIGQALTIGDRLTIGQRNREGAIRLLHEHCKLFRERLSAQKVSAILFQGCVARGPALFDGPHEEAGLIADYFPNTPVLGLYGNGEFFGQELQSYAAVLTAILE